MKAFSVPASLCLLSFLHCTIADPAGVALLCDANNPCPEGRQCTDGQCADPAAQDASISDLTVTTDLSEVSGCRASNGTRLGTGQWLCPGSFGGASPKASTLCANGFTLCATLDAQALAACNAAAGFFASSVIGSRKDTAPVGTGQCDQKELIAVVYGCGIGNGLVASMACSGFPKLIDCTSFGWSCGTTLDGTSSLSPKNGVLCCK